VWDLLGRFDRKPKRHASRRLARSRTMPAAVMHSPRPSPSTGREPDSERNDGSALPRPRDHSLLLVSDGIGKRS
jgi:hypothetical protein